MRKLYNGFKWFPILGLLIKNDQEYVNHIENYINLLYHGMMAFMIVILSSTIFF